MALFNPSSNNHIMSSAEAIVALGVFSPVISIVDGTGQNYDAAKDAQGLPEAFREVTG